MDMDFRQTIAPFSWADLPSGASSVSLSVGSYLQKVFDTRAEEGFLGNGYDWESLAQVFLAEQCPHLTAEINFDPEGDTFCVYSKNKETLREFILRFKAACEDRALILDLFRRAELD